MPHQNWQTVRRYSRVMTTKGSYSAELKDKQSSRAFERIVDGDDLGAGKIVVITVSMTGVLTPPRQWRQFASVDSESSYLKQVRRLVPDRILWRALIAPSFSELLLEAKLLGL